MISSSSISSSSSDSRVRGFYYTTYTTLVDITNIDYSTLLQYHYYYYY